jgi:hypothetical protein
VLQYQSILCLQTLIAESLNFFLHDASSYHNGVKLFLNFTSSTGNVLAWVQQVHKPVELWNITFGTGGF